MTAEQLHRAVPLTESPDPKSIIGTCDFLISQTLRFDRALLHARSESPPGKNIPFFIVDRSESLSAVIDCLIYTSNTPDAMPFRSILGRFGASYMSEGCLYGGFANGTIFHDQKTFGYNLFMSNDGRSDFWIRLYTWKLEEAVESNLAK